MTDLTVFNFESNNVRVITINNEPWFVAGDLALVLDYADTRRMLDRVDEEDKQVVNPHSLDLASSAEPFNSNTFKLSIVNESGLYAIIFGSTKVEAKKFKRWVTSEVLPTLHRTGQYNIEQLSPAEMLLAQATQMVAHEKKLREHEQQLLLLKLKQEEYDIRAQEANEVLNLLPKSEIPLLATNDRAAINQLVRAFVVSKGTSYSAVWGKLYTELYYRYSYDAKARSKNTGGKLKPLDCIERDGYLTNLYSIASSVLI